MDGKKEGSKKSYSNIYSLKKRAKSKTELLPVIYQLSLKSGNKLRRKKRMATGVALWLLLNNGSWHKVGRVKSGMVNGWEIYREAIKLLPREIKGEVRRVVIYIFDLKPALWIQDDLFGKRSKFIKLTKTADLIIDILYLNGKELIDKTLKEIIDEFNPPSNMPNWKVRLIKEANLLN